jgi:hypothetical protein
MPATHQLTDGSFHHIGAAPMTIESDADVMVVINPTMPHRQAGGAVANAGQPFRLFVVGEVWARTIAGPARVQVT